MGIGHPRSRPRAYVPDPNADIADYLQQRRALQRRRRLEDRTLFAEYLRTSVTRASPILIDLAAKGLDLPRELSRLRPPAKAPRLPRHPKSIALRHLIAAAPVAPGFADRHSRIGVIVRGPDDPRGRLGISVEYGCLNVEVGFGRHVLMTWGGEGELVVAGLLPETLVLGCVGRPLDEVVEADLIAGRGYEILETRLCPKQRTTTLEFRADTVPYFMP